MTFLDHHDHVKGRDESEGNALPRRLATFCATYSNLLHLVTLRWVAQNGLGGELTPEPTSPGMIFPLHLGPN